MLKEILPENILSQRKMVEIIFINMRIETSAKLSNNFTCTILCMFLKILFKNIRHVFKKIKRKEIFG